MADPQANPNTAFQTGTDPAAINAVYAPGATQTAVTGQAPTPVTPPPQTNVTVNTSPAVPTTPQSAPGATQTSTTATTTQPGALPQNGSVVDLLNSAGQDSSYAARQQLAQQYGIQGYTGTAAQNTDLAKKYTDAFAAKQGTTVPQTGAAASSALDAHFQQNSQTPVADPQKNFFDQYLAMNPIVKNLYDTINQTLSSVGTQQTFAQEYQGLVKQQGIPGLQTDLLNINNIMDGTEDDIRQEITSAGGSATESQVAAMSGARNKTLLKQANVLSQQLQTKQDYVKQVMQFSQADRAEVEKQVEQKIGLTSQLADLQEKMTNAAKDNYTAIIQTQGYGGLYASIKDNPQQLSQVENMLGLGNGGLKNLANYTKPLTTEETLRNQNLSLQNQKLTKDLNAPSGGADLQFVTGTANQPAGVFNKSTGKFTPVDAGTKDTTLQTALAQSNIEQIGNLITSPGLAGSVGPNTLARSAPDFDFFTGVRSNFIAGVQQLSNQLTITNLQNSKQNGATFGALSDGERELVAGAATKLSTWALKDGSGNVIGYNASEHNFKAELDKINNFAKLDYVLKGGDPSSVNVVQMQDGSLWTKNSDGTNVEIK